MFNRLGTATAIRDAKVEGEYKDASGNVKHGVMTIVARLVLISILIVGRGSLFEGEDR
mgnify:CR=1 FL=1